MASLAGSWVRVGVVFAAAAFWAEPRDVGRPPADEVCQWNIASCEITSVARQNAIITSRAVAMMHLAIHDALNAIERRYEPYVYDTAAETGAHAGAAIASAARDVLGGVIPGFPEMTPEQRSKAVELLDGTYKEALAKIPDGESKERGIATGQAAARAILNLRKPDKCDATIAYTPGTAPGQWRPHPNPVPANPPIENAAKAAGNSPAVLPHWGSVTPFTMAAPWQFRLGPPPGLETEAYAHDFEEVKRLGAKDGSERTAEQTEIAKCWYDGSPHHWSRIARIVGAERRLDRWDHARLLALVNMAVADGYIAGADTRYHYNYWRPVTAIRAADEDGNAATSPAPAWETFLNTPALPDYPSTHSVCSGAAAVVLARFFGTDQVSFTMTSGPPFAGIERSFRSFSDAAKEVCDSRVYAGVHFRTACTEGLKLGQRIGRRAAATQLLPAKP
jgi:hypothetical protein